ncbi:hypothetical protein [Ruegeria sp. AU67]|uniref:hypothetical protein n=1 Tax=Ruegeria sp. AU67 TaxID=2108530 RepID=UPI00135CCD49|nr:hypothetical protein [Ruegeria sp. AU67]
MTTLPTTLVDLKSCPQCNHKFEPKRSNQKFCSRVCQKAATHNTSRGNRKSENALRNERHYARAKDLAEMIYSAPPLERYGIMKHILSFVDVDAGLRNILCDPLKLKAEPRLDSRMNFAKAANAFTQQQFGVSIKTYIRRVLYGEELELVEIDHNRSQPAPMTLKRRQYLEERRNKPLGSQQKHIDLLRMEAEDCSETDPDRSARLSLKADRWQCRTPTKEDFERIDKIVNTAVNSIQLDDCQFEANPPSAYFSSMRLCLESSQDFSKNAT